MIMNDRLVIRRRIENSKKFVSIMEGMRLKGTMKNGEINSFFFFSEFTFSLNFNTEKYSIIATMNMRLQNTYSSFRQI